MQLELKTCPKCSGYGVLDSGKNCTNCGGSGWGGLHGTGCIGSGEVMYDKDTGRRVTVKQLVKMQKKSNEQRANLTGMGA